MIINKKSRILFNVFWLILLSIIPGILLGQSNKYLLSGKRTIKVADGKAIYVVRNLNTSDVANINWKITPSINFRPVGLNKCEIYNLRKGTYSIQAIIELNDRKNHIVFSEIISINILEQANSSTEIKIDQIQETKDVFLFEKKPKVVLNSESMEIEFPVSRVTVVSKSFDEEGNILKHSWIKLSGPTGGAINILDNNSVSIENLIEGFYLFRLTVKNPKGQSSYKDFRVKVRPSRRVNKKPEISVVGPLFVFDTVDTVVLNAKVIDPDGYIISYEWEQLDGPKAFFRKSNLDFIIDKPTVGKYYIKFKVKDNDGEESSFYYTFEVIEKERKNKPPTVQLLNESMSVSSESNFINLRAFGYDEDGKIANILWEQIDGPRVKLNGFNSDILKLKNLKKGEYHFKVTVTDEKGASSFKIAKVLVGKNNSELPVTTKSKITHTHFTLGLVSSKFTVDDYMKPYESPYNAFFSIARESSKKKLGWYLKGKISLQAPSVKYTTDNNQVLENNQSVNNYYYLLTGTAREVRNGICGGLLFGHKNVKLFLGAGWGMRDLIWAVSVNEAYSEQIKTGYWAKNLMQSYNGLEVESGFLIRISRVSFMCGISSIVPVSSSNKNPNQFSFFDAHAGIGFNIKR